MTEKKWIANPSPWTPMQNAIDLKHIGKFTEELGECVSSCARCLIQGIDESQPSTGVVNRVWLTDEIADVIANAELVIDHFSLDVEAIRERAEFKKGYLRIWHNQAGNP